MSNRLLFCDRFPTGVMDENFREPDRVGVSTPCVLLVLRLLLSTDPNVVGERRGKHPTDLPRRKPYGTTEDAYLLGERSPLRVSVLPCPSTVPRTPKRFRRSDGTRGGPMVASVSGPRRVLLRPPPSLISVVFWGKDRSVPGGPEVFPEETEKETPLGN